MKLATVYELLDPRTGEIRYVGWTSNSPALRLQQHLWDARYLQAKPHRCKWILELLRDGLIPLLDVVAIGEVAEGPATERAVIAARRRAGMRLTNVTDGGEGAPGLSHPHSPETRAKMHLAHLGNKYRLGTKASPETRAKMSAAH